MFSACIDLALDLIPTQYGGPYPMSLLYLAAGCLVMALGISLEVMADVIMLPGEAFCPRPLPSPWEGVRQCEGVL